MISGSRTGGSTSSPKSALTSWDLVRSHAKGIGVTRRGMLVTTLGEGSESNHFGEQATLSGGVGGLIKAGIEMLVQAGLKPSGHLACCLDLAPSVTPTN
jgi:ketol-acid reductoisomerase